MDIVFVRHGRTSINEQGRYGGIIDTEISKRGEIEVMTLKKCLLGIEFDAVYSSPLKRSMQTAHILSENYIVDDRLREMNFGIFEGLTYFEINEKYPREFGEWQRDFLNYRIEGGESFSHVFARTKDFIEDVSKRHKRVLAVTHGGVIGCALSLVLGSCDYFYKFRINHGTGSIISADGGYMYIKGINCTLGIKEMI